MSIKWEAISAGSTNEFQGPPVPERCEAGPMSHTWEFYWARNDGMSITTDECKWCNRTAQLSDWPSEYLSVAMRVRLEAHVERYASGEADYHVRMVPVAPEVTS